MWPNWCPTARWTASTSSPNRSTRSLRSSSTPPPPGRGSSAAPAAGPSPPPPESIGKVPPQSWVNEFLPPYDRGDLLLHPDNPITVAPQVNEDWLMERRKDNDEAMKRAQ